MKKLKFMLPVFIVFVLFVLVKIFTPEPTDWSFSFSKDDKIPFGSYIIFNELNKLFPGNSVESTNLPFYNINRTKKITNKNIIIICNNFSPDKLDSKILFEYLESGNNLFIAANYYYSVFTDSFNIGTTFHFMDEFDSTFINFSNPILESKFDYAFVKGKYSYYFSSFDTSAATVLGQNSLGEPVFIKIKYGDGNLFLHSVPTAFTNYNILNSNRDYIFKALSYLPNTGIIWDEYYKEINKYQSTPIRYILSQPALKWSYFTLILSGILFVIFKGRRHQRIIPLIKPLSNTTLEFVNTVSNLYFKQSNHKNIADKKITYFLDSLRSRYNVKTIQLNDQFAIQLSQKSTVDVDEIKIIVKTINSISDSKSITKTTLFDLSNKIENFYIKTGMYGK